MNKKLLSLFCLLAVIQIGFAQPVINDRFPVGHYELSINEIHFSLDLFENKRMTFHYQLTGAGVEAGLANVLITGNVISGQDTLLIETDAQSQWAQILYTQNPDIKKGKIRIRYIDNDNPDDYVVNYMTSIAVGQHLKRDDYQSWDEFAEDHIVDEDACLAEVDYQPGDTLSLRLYSPLASGRGYYYQYVLPSKVNDLRISFTSGAGVFDLDAAKLCKGASDNEMKLVFNFKESISLYYTRPVNDADLQQHTGSLPGVAGYAFMKANKSYMTSEEEEKEEAAYEDPYADYQYPVDTIAYFTSLDKAVKVARDSNRFVRLYTLGPDVCDGPNPLVALQGVNAGDDYYTKEFMKEVQDDYVICILPAYDAKVTKQYDLDMMQPARVVLTKDGVLLYKEHGCREDKSSLAYFNEDLNYYDYEAATFYGMMVTLYNQRILGPQIREAGKADQRLLKEYLDHVFGCVMRDSYAVDWSSVCQGISDIKRDSTGYAGLLPDTCISATEIGVYLDRYVGGLKNGSFDASLAEMIMLYYSRVYDYTDYPVAVPASLSYLARHFDQLDTVAEASDYLAYVTPYDLIGSVIYPLSYQSDQTKKHSIGGMMGVMERVLKELPASVDRMECVYDLYEYPG